MHPFPHPPPYPRSPPLFFLLLSLLLFLLPPPSAALHSSLRISVADVSQRESVLRLVQTAAFEQFSRVHKTGTIYNVSVPSVSSTEEDAFQAIRLRSGSLTRKGVNIREFRLPPGSCKIQPPAPLRILLVYARFLNLSLFQNLPVAPGFGAVTANPPVVSLLAYDATGILGNQSSAALPPLNLSADAAAPISILFGGSSSDAFFCASFDQSTPAVNYSEPVGSACEAVHLGTFATVGNPPPPSPSPASSRNKSNTWKIVVGAVVGGVFALVALLVVAWAATKGWERARVAKMQRAAEQEETLKSTAIRNSRAPAAADTRTQPSLERDYVT